MSLIWLLIPLFSENELKFYQLIVYGGLRPQRIFLDKDTYSDQCGKSVQTYGMYTPLLNVNTSLNSVES